MICPSFAPPYSGEKNTRVCQKRVKEKHNALCLVFSRVRKPNETCCDRFSHA